MRSMGDTLRSTFRRALRLENRRVVIRPGRLEHFVLDSEILGGPREVTVYLPAGYDERDERRYPVLYMHDGQNLFEAHRSFIPGQHWRLADAANEMIGHRKAEPMIIVGLDNGGPLRIDEYTPSRDEKRKAGGRAADHARMLFEELKPEIDRRYRTKTDRASTGIGGSSLGGLVALWLALRHPDVFGYAAVMSPSVWWNGRDVLKDVEAFSGQRPRIWLDIGGREGIEALADARVLRDRLRQRGWSDADFKFYEDRRGDHSERAWAVRAPMMLEFLLPPV